VQSSYEHLLSTEGLTALDPLRDADEALQPAVKLRPEDAQRTRAPEDNATLITSALALGPLILRARERSGLSQSKLAKQAGVGRRFVSEVENGKSSLEFDKVLKVAAAAGVSLSARSTP
jgi:y4mF family transcriptional regulator